MNRIDLICNHCGTSFQVASNEDYATCPACRTHLKIEEDDHTLWTVVVEQREYTTKPIPAETLTIPMLKQNLAELDKAWKVELENYKIKDDKGNMILPRRNRSIALSILSVVLIMAGIFGWSYMWFIFVGFGFLKHFKEAKKALEYEKAKQLYEDQREDIREAIFLLN